MAISDPIVVTACDERFAGFARSMLSSLRRHRALDSMPIGLLDLGLESGTREAFSAAGVRVVQSRWDFDFPARETWERDHRAYMGLTVRPHLPKYFPEHDAILWIDADVWVQLPEGVTAFLDALRDAPAVAVLELDRSYLQYLYRPRIWRFHNNFVKVVCGTETAGRMAMRPLINAGLFAIRADAPHWAVWETTMDRALQSLPPPFEENHFVDQVALNVAVYLSELPTAFLPAPFNWSLIAARPRWCPQRRLYVEPSPPHAALLNLHLTGASKAQRYRIRVLGGEATFDTALDYENALRNAPTGETI